MLSVRDLQKRDKTFWHKREFNLLQINKNCEVYALQDVHKEMVHETVKARGPLTSDP
jgi:hypothetical protein